MYKRQDSGSIAKRHQRVAGTFGPVSGNVSRETKHEKKRDKSMIMSKETLIKSIREIPDFPIPGILFYDVTTLFKDPWLSLIHI